jgi:acetyltransferase-like isoleucine patch superfamily enzyme
MVIITKIRAIQNEYYRKKFKSSYKDLRFHPESSNFTYKTIRIGKNVFINEGAYFSGDILIGNNVLIGPDVFITSSDHDYRIVGQFINQQKRVKSQQVIIDDDCWVGTKAFINRGVHIYEGAIIGALSIVTKDVTPYTLCLGTPCKPIKLRYTDEELREHYRLLNKSREDADKIISIRRSMLISRGLNSLLYDQNDNK